VKRLVVFASGSGSNFQAIIDAAEKKDIHAAIAGLIADRDGIGAIDRAKKHQIPVKIIPTPDTGIFAEKLKTQLALWSPDLIVLAGFLKKIPDDIVKEYAGKIINIHPALLPEFGGKGFYGLHVHQAVLEAGKTKSGCTVHYVNEEYDRGDIIEQKEVPVYPSDTPGTLAARVLKSEHKLLPSVIKKIINPKT
jgi:phosphoribosylglycinamide formyltransferase 1